MLYRRKFYKVHAFVTNLNLLSMFGYLYNGHRQKRDWYAHLKHLHYLLQTLFATAKHCVV